MNPQPLITTTEAVDTAFYVIFGISGVSLLGITLAMIYIIWRYNRKRQPQPVSQKDHNIWLEATWIVIPTILVGIMFWYGWEGYLSLRRIPDNAIPIQGSSRMWSWLFTYENGKTSDKLYVPVGQPVKIRLTSEDVLHSFYVPAFRVKRDCVPGMETYVWFVAEEPGSYDLFCAEYCGVAHSSMITTVEAIPPAEFAGWLEEKLAVVDAGQTLADENGCLGCHSTDGTSKVGPSFKGLMGSERTIIKGEQQEKVLADNDYLIRAIREPSAEIVEGYPAVMPPYPDFSDDDIKTLQDWLETLK
ncbi:MAG: cytochrome c oxidase subunit II [Desulfuromonadales bacterium]|nr:cytochrome c oxidase subunit II [Desulfuromonadales bacterium]